MCAKAPRRIRPTCSYIYMCVQGELRRGHATCTAVFKHNRKCFRVVIDLFCACACVRLLSPRPLLSVDRLCDSYNPCSCVVSR